MRDMQLMPFAPLRALIASCLVAHAITGCSDERAHASKASELEVIELRYQGSASVVSYPELAEDLGYFAPLKLSWVGNTISGPQSIQTVVTGDTDFGSAFNGAVVKLIAAKAPLQAVIGSYGVDEQAWTGFYVKENSPIRTARDLIGKKVAMNTLGAHHEFMLREYLARAGLTPAEAKQVTLLVVPPINGEQALRYDQVDVATLGSVFRDRALERGGIRPLFTDVQLYGPFTAGSYVFTRDFIREHPKTVRKFVDGVGRAIEWARAEKPQAVRARMQAILNERKRPAEDGSLVKYWRSTGIAAPYGVIADREFQVWVDWLLKDHELEPGQLALSDLFTNVYNSAWKKP
jgi:ABC-type nitrate/sulfonate/bicarbonate transport system substrate-binding protein